MARAALTCGICTRAAVTKLAVSLGGGAMAQGADFQVPSGQGVEFLQEIEAAGSSVAADTIGKSTHFRFVYPTLTRAQSYEDVAQDLMYLCNEFAVPRLAEYADTSHREVVISVAKEPTEFGEITPDIPKFFESFIVQDGTCDWADF